MNKKLFRSIVMLLVIAAVLALVVIQFSAITSGVKAVLIACSSVFYAIVFALILDRPFKLILPLFQKIFSKAKKKDQLSTGFSILLTYILLFALITFFLIAVIPELANSITGILNNIDTYVSNLQNFVLGFIERIPFLRDSNFASKLNFQELSEKLVNLISDFDQIFRTVIPQIYNITISITNFLVTAFLTTVISIYLLYDQKHLIWQAKKTTHILFPDHVANVICRIAKLSKQTFTDFISGRIIDSIIIGILCFIFMKLFGFNYASLISFLVGVTNVIPIFGPFIGAIPSALLLLLVNPKQCFWFIVFILILQQIDGNIIGPRVVGGTTGLKALWVTIALTIGQSLFGLTGLLLSVPCFAVFYTLIREFLINKAKAETISLDDEQDKRITTSKKRTIVTIKEKIKKFLQAKQNK